MNGRFVPKIRVMAVLLLLTAAFVLAGCNPDNSDGDFSADGCARMALVFADEIAMPQGGGECERRTAECEAQMSVREFVIDNDTGAVFLPAVLIECYNPVTNITTYDKVAEEDIVFFNNERCSFNGLQCLASDYYCAEFEETVTMRVAAGEKPLERKLNIVKRPRNVESVIISVEGGESTIGLTEHVNIVTDVKPYNATYQDCYFVVERIVRADGELYEGNLAQYAYIENEILYTTKKIDIGSEIYFYAVIESSGIKSNILCMEVVRIEAERVEICSEQGRNYVMLGEDFEIQVRIYPENATMNVLKDLEIKIDINDERYAIVEQGEEENVYILKVTDNVSFLDETISVCVRADGVGANAQYRLEGVGIEDLYVIDRNSGTELDDITYLRRGDVLELGTVVTPEDAAVKDIVYEVFSSTANFGAYISVDGNGALKISQNAPAGFKACVYARSGQHTSRSYKIVVEEIAIQYVELSCDDYYIKRDECASLTLSVKPDDAYIWERKYYIKHAVKGVYISGNLVHVSEDAEKGVEVVVYAVVNGVESNEVRLTVG